MKQFIICLLILIYIPMNAQKTKVACIGNSVTYGSGIENREINCYPVQLQQLLGERYEVVNFGKPGTTLLSKGHRPYIIQDEYRKALDFAGDHVIIHLGLNDTDPRNWPNYKEDFTKDYICLIESFRKANPKCKIWICRMTPITHQHPRFKSGTRDWYWQIQKAIENVACYPDVELIDLQEGLYSRPDLLPDALHPVKEGAGIIAKTIYSALTGDYGGLQLPILYTNNMVLQRNKPLHISGIANSGKKVTVRLDNKQARATTGTNGKWSITLPAMPAGGPYTLTIETKERSLIYREVLIGEVWLCSGQSNMAFTLSQAATGKIELSKIAEKKSSPLLRFFDMKARWQTNAQEWDASTLDSLNNLQYYSNTEWTTCNEKTARNMSAIAYYFGSMLADSLQVPIGLIHNAIGGSPTESWINRKTLEFEFPDILDNWTKNDMIQAWARERAALNIKKSANKQQRHPYAPSYLFEAGIEPLQAYPVQGIIWYQGESNAHNKEIHEILFPLMVQSWRQHWNEELPFYYVQLSSIDRPSWPDFRDSQRQMMYSIPNTGMVVSSDKGDSLDVHPIHKQEIGERLARWALYGTYHHDLIPSGPLFRNAERKGSDIYLSFDYAEGMHSADGKEIISFELAEIDGLYISAQAEIFGNKIKVSCSDVKHPQYVRYGWQPYTRANLINKEKLPASTFKASVTE